MLALALSLLAITQASPDPLTVTDTAHAAGYGWSVDISGDVVVVGAPFDDTHADNGGTIHIFERTPAGWTRTFTDQGAADQRLGYSVAIDGDHAVASQFQVVGVVRTYERIAGLWVRTGSLDYPGNPATAPGFGRSMEIDGDRLVIGALGATETVLRTGAAYVYESAGANWTLMQTIVPVPTAGTVSINFGENVTLEGDWLAVSVLVGGTPEARVLERVNATWVEHTRLSDPFQTQSTRFGIDAIRLSAIPATSTARAIPILGVSDTSYTTPGRNRVGSVVLFELAGGTWSVGARLFDQVPTNAGQFGFRFDIDEDWLAVGHLPWQRVNVGFEKLTVDCYRRQPDGTWPLIERKVDPHVATDTGYGAAIAIDGDNLAIGARSAPVDNEIRGAAYVAAIAPTWRPIIETACVGSLCPCPAYIDWLGCRNSTRREGSLTAFGSASLSADDLGLVSFNLPPGRLATFRVAPSLGPLAPFGSGVLCLDQPVGFGPQIVDPFGRVSLPAGVLGRIANLGAHAPVMVGQTWHFQTTFTEGRFGIHSCNDPPPGSSIRHATQVPLPQGISATNAIAVMVRN